jgi:hypothetical protein
MTMPMPMQRLLAILALILCYSTNHAFVTIRSVSFVATTPNVGSHGDGTTAARNPHGKNRCTTTTTLRTETECPTLKSFVTSSTKLAAKKTGSKKKEDDKVKQEWDASLLIQFMTPWKNPNSIFVYMIGLLYLLGKYSEAHSRLP